MTDPIDVAYVEIRADGSKFGPDVAGTVDREMAKSGKQIKDSIVKPVDEAAKQTGSIFSGLGQSISNGLRPGITQVNNFRAGFNDSRAAASAFTGTMGTLGGVTRTALNPSITALQNFHSGFVSTDAAASAFTGRMGTLGGVVRSTLNPAITSVQNFHSGLVSSDAAASVFSGRMGTLGGVVTSTFRVGQSAVTGFGNVVGSTFRGAQTVAKDFGNIGSQVASKIGSAFETSARNMESRFTGAMTRMKGAALGIGGALGVGGIGALIGAGISRISDIEQTTKSLQVMTGSASKAKDVMNELLTFAKTTPFSFPDVSEIGRNLVAFGVDTSKVVPILKSLGDAASASGQGTQAMQSLGNAIGSVAIAGSIGGQDLQSFQAVGVPALKILANTAGVSADEMAKRISKGTVDSNFAIDSLVKGIENGTNGLAGQTAKMGGIMASQKDTIAGTMDSFKSSVTSTMATLLTPAIPLMRQGVGAIGNEFKKLPALITTIKDRLQSLGFIDAIKNMFAGIGNIISAIWPVLQRFGQVFAVVFGAGTLVILRALGAAFQWIGDRIRQFLPVLQPIATVLGAVWGATMLLRTALMLGGAAMLVWKGIMVAFGPIMKIFTALQWALNVAMNANPISLIIIAIVALVAAFVILWNKSAGFRQFWIGLWQTISDFFIGVWHGMQSVFTTVIDALKSAWNAAWKFISDIISAVWNGFLKPIFDAITAAVQAVGAAAQWLWLNILQPVFNFIGAAAVIMGKIMLGLVLIPLVAFWQFVLAPTALWLWHNVIEPVFNGIGAVVQFTINNIIIPIQNMLVASWKILEAAALWFWHNVIERVWNGIGAIIQFTINNVIMPVANFLKGGIDLLGATFVYLWQNYVVPAWNAIGNAISFGWHNIIEPIFHFIKGGVDFLGATFNYLWHNYVEPIWNGIGNAIRFVWDKVISPAFEAIKNGVSRVGDFFSSAKDTVERIWGQLGDIAMKPIRFVVNTVLDDGLIAGWNKVVDFLHLGFLHIPPIPRLATGGIIPGYTPGRDTHMIAVGGGEAVMRPEWTRAAGAGYVHGANQAARSGGVGGAQSFIQRNGLPGYSVGQGFANGGVVGWIGNALSSVGDFVGGAFNGLMNFGGQVLDFISSPVDSMEKLLNGIISGIGMNVGDVGKFADLALQAPKNMVGGMVQKIKDWWNSFMAQSGANVGGAGVQRWAPLVLQALAMLGQPASLLPNVLRRMNQESGGNPNAINNWDSNAAAGHPSQGLMQTIPGTFAAYAGPFASLGILNPLANIYAGLNYAIHRYPSLQYAMDKPGGYDGGGWLMPGQFGYNGTSTPEPVFNSAQWSAITSSLDVKNAASELLNRIASGGSIFEDLSFYGQSRNGAANNDLLTNLFGATYGQQDFGANGYNTAVLTQFLSSVVTSTTRQTSATTAVATATQRTTDTLADKLDAIIALLRQRQTLRADLVLDGKVLAQWFQQLETMGGV
jgi:tape measure domain-containing protein